LQLLSVKTVWVMKWSLEGRWIAGGFGLALFIMGMVSLASLRNVMANRENADRVRQTYEILNTLTNFYAAMAIAESGRRGYIFWGDNSEKIRHQVATQDLEIELTNLTQQIGHDPKLQPQLDQLVILTRQRLDLFKQSIELYQKNPGLTERQAAITGDSVQLRGKIQALLKTMRAEEEARLEQSIKTSQANSQSRLVLELIGTLFSFLVVLAVCIALYRGLQQRRQLEQLEQQLAHEQELGDLKLRLFSMVSHEFRTPLSVILASAQLLKEILQDLVDADKLKNLQRIQTSARLMNQLLTDILTLTRAEAGKLEYKPESLDIEAFCLNLVEDIQFSNSTHHQIQFSSQGVCGRVNLDEKLMYSILSNLLLNAIKYSPQGSTVCLRLNCQPDRTILQVSDTGIGIALTDREKLYDPFFRGQNAAAISGTGLGLAVVKKCLELQGGTITVKSQMGAGTTFTVTLPRLPGLTPSSSTDQR